MNICKECKLIDEQNSLCPFHWKCRCKAKWKPLCDPVTGDDRSKYDRVPLCCDVNKDGTCMGFERKAEPCEHERCYSEQTMKAMVKERDCYRRALIEIKNDATDFGEAMVIARDVLEDRS